MVYFAGMFSTWNNTSVQEFLEMAFISESTSITNESGAYHEIFYNHIYTSHNI